MKTTLNKNCNLRKQAISKWSWIPELKYFARHSGSCAVTRTPHCDYTATHCDRNIVLNMHYNKIACWIVLVGLCECKDPPKHPKMVSEPAHTVLLVICMECISLPYAYAFEEESCKTWEVLETSLITCNT